MTKASPSLLSLLAAVCLLAACTPTSGARPTAQPDIAPVSAGLIRPGDASASCEALSKEYAALTGRLTDLKAGIAAYHERRATDQAVGIGGSLIGGLLGSAVQYGRQAVGASQSAHDIAMFEERDRVAARRERVAALMIAERCAR